MQRYIYGHPKIQQLEQYGARDVNPTEQYNTREFHITKWVVLVLFISGSAVFAAIVLSR